MSNSRCRPFFVAKTFQRGCRPGMLPRCRTRFWQFPGERLPVLCAGRSSRHITASWSTWVFTGERNSHVVSVGKFLSTGGIWRSTHRHVCKVIRFLVQCATNNIQVLPSCTSTTGPNMVLIRLLPKVGLFAHFVGNLFRSKRHGGNTSPIVLTTLIIKVLIIAGLLGVRWPAMLSPV